MRREKISIEFHNLESKKLIDLLNSLGELCGVYKMPVFLSMCALCPVDVKQGCYKKYTNEFGNRYSLRLLDCLYAKIKKHELRADKEVSEVYFIIHCVISFFYKYKKIPGLFKEYPLVLKVSQTGSIDFKRAHSYYREEIIKYLIKNK